VLRGRQAHQQFVVFHAQAQLAFDHEDMAAEHALFLHVVAAGQGFAHGVYEVQRGVGERAGGHGVG